MTMIAPAMLSLSYFVFYPRSMPFVELDPEVVLKAIEGFENELDPELRALDSFYRQFVCPRCRGETRKEFSGGERGGHAFADSSTLNPRALLRCVSPVCGCLFDPHSGLLVERGKPPSPIKAL
jgi:hypothetical protein